MTNFDKYDNFKVNNSTPIKYIYIMIRKENYIAKPS